MKRKAPVKKILISLVALVLVGAIAAGIFFSTRTPKEPVNVFAFYNIGMTEYWGDSQESSGYVQTDRIQTVFLSDTQTVTEILVSEGDSVQKGDILMTFDTTLTDISLERKRLDVEKLKLQLEDAKDQLEKIKRMRPMVIPAPSDDKEEENEQGTELKKSYQISKKSKYDGSSPNKALICWIRGDTAVDDDIFRALLEKAEAYQTKNAQKNESGGSSVSRNLLSETSTEAPTEAPTEPPTEAPTEPPTEEPTEPPTEEPTEPPTEEPTEPPTEEPTVPPTEEPTEPPTEEPTEPPTEEPTEPPTEEPTEPPTEEPTEPPTEEPTEPPTEEPTEPPTEEPTEEPEEPEDPTEPETVTVNQFYVVFKVTSGNLSLGSRIVWQGFLVTKQNDGSFGLKFFDASALPDHTLDADQEVPDKPEIDYGSGYTASQIAEMRSRQEKTIKELEFNIKMEETEYKIMQTEVSDGMVYAEVDGVVTSVLSEAEAQDNGLPILKVSGGGGFFVEGSISELARDTVTIGSEVTINDWRSGVTYFGTIESIGDYPSSNGYWSGAGNPTATYYPFTVFVEEDADLQSGSYVSIVYSAGANQNGIYLENPFLRTEGGRSYVYLRGEDGKLEQRFVTTGKSLWGSYTEILEGLTDADFLAFPYGTDVKPGAPTVEADLRALYE